MFCRNVGGIDRIVRLVLGPALLAAGVFLLATERTHGWTAIAIGAFVLASGVLGFCPPYVLLGISTAQRTSCGCASREGPGRREPT